MSIDDVLKTLEVQLHTGSGLGICAKYGKKFNCVEFTTRDDVAQPVLISPWMQFEPSEMSDLRHQIATEIARRAINYPSLLKEIESLKNRLSYNYDRFDDNQLQQRKIYETWGKERAKFGLADDFTDVVDSEWPKELMGDYRTNDSWKPLISAPKDATPVLFGGTWKPYDLLPGGEKIVRIYRWSTIMSDGTGYNWMDDNFGTPDDVNVEWTHWRPVPEFYV